MNKTTLNRCLILASALLFAPWISAQPIKETQKQELAIARRQALAQNPQLEQNLKAAQQALAEAHAAIISAMEQIDPKVSQILEEIRAAEKKVDQDPQLRSEERAARELRRKLMNEDDPGYSNDSGITPLSQSGGN